MPVSSTNSPSVLTASEALRAIMRSFEDGSARVKPVALEGERALHVRHRRPVAAINASFR